MAETAVVITKRRDHGTVDTHRERRRARAKARASFRELTSSAHGLRQTATIEIANVVAGST
jgi:hypothetical protein